MVILNIDILINKKSMINSVRDLMVSVMDYYMENESYAKDKKKLFE
jgi:hypothetical protein